MGSHFQTEFPLELKDPFQTLNQSKNLKQKPLRLLKDRLQSTPQLLPNTE